MAEAKIKKFVKPEANDPRMDIYYAVTNQLIAAKFPYKQVGSMPIAVVPIENAVEPDKKFGLTFAADNFGYDISVVSDVKVPEKAYAAVSEYLMRANLHVRHGAFRLNYETGAVSITASIYCGKGGTGTGCALLMMYEVAHAYMAFGGSKLAGVISGKLSPADAESAAKETLDVLMNPQIKK